MDSAPGSICWEDSQPKIRHHYSLAEPISMSDGFIFVEGGSYNAFSIFIYVPISALKVKGWFIIVTVLVACLPKQHTWEHLQQMGAFWIWRSFASK